MAFLLSARLLSLWELGKVFFCLSEKVFLSERVEPATFGTIYSAKTGALAIMTVASLNKSCGFKVRYKCSWCKIVFFAF
jgi:hypothetical protein